MIFIWYGNVYTYASQLINYSYCLVFFCLSVIYIMYSLPSTDTSFEMGKKEVKKEEKEGSVGISHFDYKKWMREKLHYIGEWQEMWNTVTEEENEDLFSLPTSVSCLSLCKTEKKKLCGPYDLQHTHMHWPHISHEQCHRPSTVIFIQRRTHSVITLTDNALPPCCYSAVSEETAS